MGRKPATVTDIWINIQVFNKNLSTYTWTTLHALLAADLEISARRFEFRYHGPPKLWENQRVSAAKMKSYRAPGMGSYIWKETYNSSYGTKVTSVTVVTVKICPKNYSVVRLMTENVLLKVSVIFCRQAATVAAPLVGGISQFDVNITFSTTKRTTL